MPHSLTNVKSNTVLAETDHKNKQFLEKRSVGYLVRTMP